MGIISHNAIVVTSWSESHIAAAHEKAREILGVLVSEILPQAINGYRSFFVGPDGSKEGWTESEIGDKRRNAFVDWLNSQRYSDGSSALCWIEVVYGELGHGMVRSDRHPTPLEVQT